MLNRDLSKPRAGFHNQYGNYPESGDRMMAPQRNILKYTRDKRPVSSHNPPTLSNQVRKGITGLASRDHSMVQGYA